MKNYIIWLKKEKVLFILYININIEKTTTEIFYKLFKLHSVCFKELIKQVEVHCPTISEYLY